MEQPRETSGATGSSEGVRWPKMDRSQRLLVELGVTEFQELRRDIAAAWGDGVLKSPGLWDLASPRAIHLPAIQNPVTLKRRSPHRPSLEGWAARRPGQPET
jgi:hypothetical protein